MGSHADSGGYSIVDGQLSVTLKDGMTTGLKAPFQPIEAL